MFARTIVIAILAVMAVATEAPARRWTDPTGRYSIDAEFIEVRDGKARLRCDNGAIVALPVDCLSEADQRFISLAGGSTSAAEDDIFGANTGPTTGNRNEVPQKPGGKKPTLEDELFGSGAEAGAGESKGVEVVSGSVTCDMDVDPGRNLPNVFPPGTSTTVVLLLRGEQLRGLTTEVFSSDGPFDLVGMIPQLWATGRKGETKAILRCCPQPRIHPEGFPNGKYQTRVTMGGKVVAQFDWSISPDSPIQPDAKRIQGKWRSVDGVKDGFGVGRHRLIVTTDAFTITLDSGDTVVCRWRLDPSTNPKQLSLCERDRQINYRAGELDPWPSLYGFHGDRLKLCIGLNGFRPGQFRSNRGDGTLMLELEREK